MEAHPRPKPCPSETDAAAPASWLCAAASEADLGTIELVEGENGLQVLYRSHHGEDGGEGLNRLIGDFDLQLAHDGRVAIRMRIRGDVPPSESLDFDRAAAEHFRTRLHAFETGCRRLPIARAA